MCVYACVQLRTHAIMDQSREDALRRGRERERERRARETPEQREARLYQRRLRGRERARERLAAETAEEREARLALILNMYNDFVKSANPRRTAHARYR